MIKREPFRLSLYLKQRGLCWLCDEALDLSVPKDTYGSCSFEHVIPAHCGGSFSRKNIVLTHWECNKARGSSIAWRVTRPRSQLELKERYLRVGFEIAVRKLCKLLEGQKQLDSAAYPASCSCVGSETSPAHFKKPLVGVPHPAVLIEKLST